MVYAMLIRFVNKSSLYNISEFVIAQFCCRVFEPTLQANAANWNEIVKCIHKQFKRGGKEGITPTLSINQ